MVDRIPSDKFISKGLIDVNIPNVVVLKRQSIRVFPDGTRIGLYYADAIKKHVSIPFSSIGVSEEVEMNEDNYAGLPKSGVSATTKAIFRNAKNISKNKPFKAYLKKSRKDEYEANKKKNLGEEMNEEHKVGDYVHLGFGAKGGAGFFGTVIKKENGTTHIRHEKSHKVFKGPSKWVSPQSDFKKDESVNENEDKSRLKQIKRWIAGTRQSKEAIDIMHGPSSKWSRREEEHLKNLNKEKKDVKKSIKAVYRKKNLERTAPKSKKQLNLKLESEQINELSKDTVKKYALKAIDQKNDSAKKAYDQVKDSKLGDIKKIDPKLTDIIRKRKKGLSSAFKRLS